MTEEQSEIPVNQNPEEPKETAPELAKESDSELVKASAPKLQKESVPEVPKESVPEVPKESVPELPKESVPELPKESVPEDDDIVEIVQVVTPNKTYNEEEARRATRQAKEAKLSDEMKFMSDFDPSNSLRKQKKNRRRYYHPDGRPMIQACDYEDCDCLNTKCPGCHYPCKNCGDTRCGHECRVNRRWVYESVEIEGWSRTLKNRNLDNFYTYEYE